MGSRVVDDIMTAFSKSYNIIVAHGSKPTLIIIDNETSNFYSNILTTQEITCQLAPLRNHCTNSVEKKIKHTTTILFLVYAPLILNSHHKYGT